jgi:hypothetical protein
MAFQTALGNLYSLVTSFQISPNIKISEDSGFSDALENAKLNYLGVIQSSQYGTSETLSSEGIVDGQILKFYFNGIPGTDQPIEITFPTSSSTNSTMLLYPQQVYSFVYRESTSGFLVIPGIAGRITSYVTVEIFRWLAYTSTTASITLNWIDPNPRIYVIYYGSLTTISESTHRIANISGTTTTLSNGITENGTFYVWIIPTEFDTGDKLTVDPSKSANQSLDKSNYSFQVQTL